MARVRDHKAEYAARKRNAQRAGYNSVSAARKARKSLALPRSRKTPSRRAAERFVTIRPTLTAKSISTMRRESQIWSDAHARRKHSTFQKSFTDAQVKKYWTAFVLDDYKGTNEKLDEFRKRMRIRDFLIPEFLKDYDEWKANPSTIPLRR